METRLAQREAGCCKMGATQSVQAVEHEQTKDLTKVLFTEEEIKTCVNQMGKRISEDYAGKNPLVVGVLTGGYVFMSDLARTITVPHVVDFVKCSSYGSGTESSGKVKFQLETSHSIEGRHVIVVEDIIDTGLTLSNLVAHLSTMGPASIEVASLLDKKARRKVEVKAKYVGLECPDEFVIGYGLDYDGAYRSLPMIGILKPEVYS
ncbi:hypothetical protein CYMTET_56886 [Cymbomonas tetramitiformis]|uniref:Hypoxanthine phosphoribosyltransferase n=1 Tax=Cymbomonas tetramitiformis TaxID=36881 RepID=A0AAE0ELV1_9CHLO|nr:hypothetical protein CYMTET_56886 [Cymbomonas tetramitiformis]